MKNPKMAALVRMLALMQMEHDSRGQWLIAEEGLEALREAGLAKWTGYEWTDEWTASSPK